MLRVLRINNNEFIIQSKTQAIYGDLTRTVLTLEDIGIAYKDVEESLVSLQLLDHQVAEFGVNKTFMYTRKIA